MVCSSWSWPNLFDVSRNKVNLYNGTQSIKNRVKLLLLTEPTELYNEPQFGVGLRKHIFKYNNDNVIALIQDELIEQLRLWEPGVIPEETTVKRGPNHQWDPNNLQTTSAEMNTLELLISVKTVYLQTVDLVINNSDLESFI